MANRMSTLAFHLRRRQADGERGSIVMALLLVMITAAFAALLGPVVLQQITTSRYDSNRQHEIDAAQAGVDVVLGQIRAANTTGEIGSLALLRCGTFSGTVTGTSPERYQASVYYFSQDPRGHDNWLSDSSKQINCVTSTSGVPYTPRFAVIVSQGTNTSTGSFSSVQTRTLQATYVFKTQNNNVQGGLIHSFGSSPDLCLDAGSSSPNVGTAVFLAPCSSGSDEQTWSWNNNLTITLSSTTSGGSLGLCLDAPFPHANGNAITLQNCTSTTTRDQQWSLSASLNFIATTSSGALDGYCFVPQTTNTANAAVQLGSCGGRDTAHAWTSDSAVGAGNAGAGQNMLVNYNQFGRCLDITNTTLPSTSTEHFLIAYPCKVTADGSNAPTNQQWNVPTLPTGATTVSGQITTVENSAYCLLSPMTLGGYPYMDKCPLVPNAASTWTITGATGEYTTSYRISDSAKPSANSNLGYCLQPTDQTLTPPDVYIAQVSKVIVTTCSGSTLQKWNAPPGVEAAPVKDFHEK